MSSGIVPPIQQDHVQNEVTDLECKSLRLKLIPGPLLTVSSAAQRAMVRHGLRLADVLRVHTSVRQTAAIRDLPVVATEIDLNGTDVLTVRTVIGPSPEKNCTFIQLSSLLELDDVYTVDTQGVSNERFRLPYSGR